MTEISKQAAAARDELKAAFDELIEDLQLARDVIDHPEYLPAPQTERNLAEGYRYLMGFIHHGIERAFHSDPEHPAMRNALSVFNKSTIDNADAIYFYADIDGSKHYRISGKAGDFAHWRGEERVGDGPFAPQYLIFETSDGPMTGDTGSLEELIPGVRTGFGTLDSSELLVEPDGSFELMLGPEKPEGFEGNFICTRKPPAKNSPDDGDRYATRVSGRQLFHDWDREESIFLDIECLDTAGQPAAPLTPERAAAQLREMGSIIKGQMRFWQEFYDKLLNCNGTYPEGGGDYFMPVNAYNTPNAAGRETGGGMSSNIYCGGIYDLKDDEALIVRATYPEGPAYTGMHLGNLWGESPDYANYQSSLTNTQMYIGEDRVQYWVVSHRDPGVQNWIDTTGLPRGFLSHRWAYSERPAEEDFPQISARLVPVDEVEQHIPVDQPRLSPDERREVIKSRQRHVRRRFRVF